MRIRAIVLCLLLTVPSSLEARAAPAPVVGGSRAPRGKWPDAVAVLAPTSICTGTLVAPEVVLTAGHCIADGPTDVVVDTVDLDRPELGGEIIPVKWARAYPSWHDRYDIGVVVLERAASVRPRKVAAACEAREQLVPGALVTVAGFGMTALDAAEPNTRLHEAIVPVIDPTCTVDAACNAAVAPHGEFLAGGDGSDACFGDSGGPVYLQTRDGPALVGIVSRSRALPGAPCGQGGVYVRADKAVAWVQTVTGARLGRTTCEGRADGPDAGDAAERGGCSTAPGAGLPLAVVMLARRRRRRTRRR